MNEKAKLLEIIAGQNRGLLANESDRVNVLTLVEHLEDQNPTPNPTQSTDLLDGDWRLLYTTSRGILGLDKVPLLQLGQVYQCIRAAEGRVYNIAEIIGIPLMDGIVSVAARFDIISEKRVNVRFERYILGLKGFLGYENPSRFIEDIETGKKFFPLDIGIENRDQKGWLEITYLDEELRIGRGNEGSVFILAKN